MVLFLIEMVIQLVKIVFLTVQPAFKKGYEGGEEMVGAAHFWVVDKDI